MTQTVTSAIDTSILEDRIVTIEDATEEDLAALMIESDDSVDNGPVVEFWGCDDDGCTWRVHVAR